jgi:SAM-dependent methyltransferase
VSARWFEEWSPAQRAEYAERFASMQAAGADIDGEARLIDAMAGRGSRILDAGCGTGRVAAGHAQHPGVPLLELDLREVSPELGTFALVVSAGNVLVYLEPGTEREVLAALASVLEPGGRAVFGFATDRAYTVADLDADAESDWAVSVFRSAS